MSDPGFGRLLPEALPNPWSTAGRATHLTEEDCAEIKSAVLARRIRGMREVMR
jgi:hypothetical protein